MDKSFAKNEGGDWSKASKMSTSPWPNEANSKERSGSGDFACQVPENPGTFRLPELKPERQVKEFSNPPQRPGTPNVRCRRASSDTILSFPTLPTPRRCLDEYRSIFDSNESFNRSPAWRRQPEERYGTYRRQNSSNQKFQIQQPSAYGSPSQRNIFEDLPQEIRWQVRKEGIVTDYFGSEITVVGFKHGEIMEACVCHVVMVLNTKTEQYLVKAFAKDMTSMEGCQIKFNRLITRNNLPKVTGNTSFVFTPIYGRLDLPHYEREKHMLNFCNSQIAAKFASALKKASQQVWNHAAVRLQGQFENISRPSSQFHRQNDSIRRNVRDGMESSNNFRRIGTNRLDSHNSVVREASSNIFKIEEVHSAEASLAKTPLRPKLLFHGSSVRLYLKFITTGRIKSAVYTFLGEGNVLIEENNEEYHHLLIVGANQELLFDQFLYPWVKPSCVQQVSESTNWEMIWTAIPRHLIVQTSTKLPVSRDFKVIGNKETILGLSEAIEQSTSLTSINLLRTIKLNMWPDAERVSDTTFIGKVPAK